MWIQKWTPTRHTFNKKIGLHAQSMLPRLIIVNIVGEPIYPFNEHENLHSDNEYSSTKDPEESGYNLNLDLLTIS